VEEKWTHLISQATSKIIFPISNSASAHFNFSKNIAVLIERTAESSTGKRCRDTTLEKESALTAAMHEELSVRISAVEKPSDTVATK
jgi:hypothetical protein